MRALCVALAVLLTGCSVISSLEGYTFDGDGADAGPTDGGPEAGVELDAGDAPDAAPDTGVVDADGGPDSCGGCSGDLPVCNEETMGCVECTRSAHCPSGTCADNNCQTVVDYSLGMGHTCTGLEDGTVWCWGANSVGQLGDGSLETRLTPTQVVGLNDTYEIAVGFEWSCAKSTSNQIRCWGNNETDGGATRTGILGPNDVSHSATPVVVAEPAEAIGLVAGDHHACFRTPSREAYCWGINWAGQLGDGSNSSRTAPVRVELSSGSPLSVDRIAGGGSHTCARDGSNLFCWGDNGFGQLGTGDGLPHTRPTAVAGVMEPTWLGLGGAQSCAIGSDGVYCWGDNPEGRLGDGTTMQRTTPHLGVSGSGWLGVASGSEHSCAWNDSGEARCWGRNDAGQLGDGTFDVDLAIHDVALSDVGSLQTGLAHTCALTTAGVFYCWGYNESGQIGDGTTTERASPVRVVWP